MMVIPYTVIIGGYDALEETKWPSVCLSDNRRFPTAKGWRVKRIPVRHVNPRRASRHPKMLPHIYFPDAEYTLYMDGNLRLLADPVDLVTKYLRHHDMALYKHPQRSCLYREAEVVVKHRKSSPKVVGDQLAYYESEGFPRDFGLTACWVILRRNTLAVQEFGELWWKVYMKFSCRDQLSFDFVRWKTDMEYAEIPGNLLYNLRENDFRRVRHGSSLE